MALELFEPRAMLTTMPLDPTFNHDGLAVIDSTFAAGIRDTLHAIEVAGGKTWMAGSTENRWGGTAGAVTRLTSTGAPDRTFGAEGRLAMTQFREFVDVQPLADGGVLLLGETAGDFGVMKLFADGSVDRSYGTQGIASANFGGFDVPHSIATLPDGSCIVAGDTNQNDFAIAKFTSQGILDGTFTGDGKTRIDFGASDRATEVVIDSTGRIVIAGTRWEQNSDFALARLTPQGTLDTTFGTQGKVISDFGGAGREDIVASLALGANGSILVAGSTIGVLGDRDFAIISYDSSGNRSSLFGAGGELSIDFRRSQHPSNDELADIKIDRHGRLVVLGTAAEFGGRDRTEVAMCVLNGITGDRVDVYDPARGGLMWFDFFGYDKNRGASLAIDNQGRWLVGSTVGINQSQFGLMRLTSDDGRPDSSFGNVGRVAYDFTDQSGTFDDAHDIAPLPNGGFVLAGMGREQAFLSKHRPNGQLDTTFAAGGKFHSAEFQSFSAVHALSDGSLLVAGILKGRQGEGDFGLLKLRPNGSLDPTFGRNGYARLDLGGNELVWSMVVQSDGKIVLAGSSDRGAADMAVARFTSGGQIDRTFDGDGWQTVDFANQESFATEVEIDASGRLVIVGVLLNGTDSDFALTRLTASGAIDTSFGAGGRVRTDLRDARRDDYAFGLEIQADGALVVGGYTRSATADPDIALARYTSAGAPISTFGSGGQAILDFSDAIHASDEAIYDIELDSSGRIVASGLAYREGENRLKPLNIVFHGDTGQIDTSFAPSSGGRMFTEFFVYDGAGAVLEIDAQGRWLSAGMAADNIGLSRRSGVDGALDPTFGNGGKIIIDNSDITHQFETVRGSTIDAQGRILAVNPEGRLFRLTSEGALDPSFATGGMFTSETFIRMNDVVALADGGILVVGGMMGQRDLDMAVMKLNSDGSIDRRFAADGIRTVDVDGHDEALKLVVLNDGRIVVGGNVGSESDFVVVRLTNNGTLDTSFSGDGIRTVDFVDKPDYLQDMAIDHRGRIILVGESLVDQDSDFALARLLPGGGLDVSFGNRGILLTDINNARSDDLPTSIVVLADGSIIVGGMTFGPTNGFLLVRYDENGQPASGFGTGGTAIVDMGRDNSGGGRILDLQIDAQGRIVALGVASERGFPGGSVTAIGVFNAATGALDTSVSPDTDGKVFLEFYGDRSPWCTSLEIDHAGRWVVLGDLEDSGTIGVARLGIPPNAAPNLNTALNPTLAPIAEDTTNPSGTLVRDLLDGAVLDADLGARRGMAIVGVTGASSGRWEFSLKGGASWRPLGNPSATSARLLPDNANTRIRFIPNADFSGQVQITYRAWDQTQGAAGAVFDITGNIGGNKSLSREVETARLRITPVNDDPVLGGISGSIGYTRNAAVVSLASSATLSDADGGNLAGGRLIVEITSGAHASNRLELGGTLFKVDANNNVLRSGVIIGRMNAGGGQGTTRLVITFNAQATPGYVQQLIRAIRFRTVGTSDTAQRTAAFTLTDGDGGTSATLTKRVNVS